MHPTDQEILTRREYLKPTPVIDGKVPTWMRKRLLSLKAEGRIKAFSNSNNQLLAGLLAKIPAKYSWFDHDGTSIVDGCEIFVNEPYHYYAEPNQAFADLLDCELYVLANSWWYPGWTIRVAFWPKTMDFNVGSMFGS